MRLYKLIIKDFRGLKGDNNVILFENSNIIFLIGQNNVGKSTYLRAYEFLTNSSQRASEEDFNDNSLLNPIIIESWFIKEDGDENEEELKIKKTTEPDWIRKWVDSDGYIKIRKTWTKFNESFLKETFLPSENTWVLNGFGGFDTLFSRYAPKAISINAMESQNTLEEKVNKLIQDEFIKKIRTDNKLLCDEITSKITELQNIITNSEKINSYNSEINSNFQKIFSDLTLKIDSSKEENIKIEDSFKKNHTISIHKTNSERFETFLQNGHGVIRQALFNFITFINKEKGNTKKEYLILFEEPELFLHPKIAFKLRETLYQLTENSPFQLICATHSPLMIDISKPQSSLIRITKDENSFNHSFQVGEDIFMKNDEQKQIVQMINRFNPHICEVFYSDKVIVVEGDTETIVYRELLKNFYPHEEIFVLNSGSKNNIPFFQKILTSFNIEHYIIHDTDSELTVKGKRNSAWTLNEIIWENVIISNKIKNGLSKRYVHHTNFETAHNINLNGNKDKPLKAYQFASQITNIEPKPQCLIWLDDILGKNEILHDMNYIESL